MSDYTQSGSNQMFWQAVFSVLCSDITCTYMPLTYALTAFILEFLYISLAFLPTHSLHFCAHKIIISKSYAFGNLNPPSKAGGLRLPFFQSPYIKDNTNTTLSQQKVSLVDDEQFIIAYCRIRIEKQRTPMLCTLLFRLFIIQQLFFKSQFCISCNI